MTCGVELVRAWLAVCRGPVVLVTLHVSSWYTYRNRLSEGHTTDPNSQFRCLVVPVVGMCRHA